MANYNTQFQTNLLEEELTDADLMAVVGGTSIPSSNVSVGVGVSPNGLEVTRSNNAVGLGNSGSSISVTPSGTTVSNSGAQSGSEQVILKY